MNKTWFKMGVISVSSFLTACLWATASHSNLISLKYDSWEILYNCEKRGYEFFQYSTSPNSGDLKRFKPFHQESRLPKRCQQFSTDTYKLPKGSKITYDRGHGGKHQNLVDFDIDIMMQTNSMANIVPQASKLNRYGAWRETEVLTQCWREFGTLTVYGGNIWGNDKSNDHFLKSHGVVTPDYLFKVIKYHDGIVNAWIFPNDNKPRKANMNNYLVSPKKISDITGFKFDLDDSEYIEKDAKSRVRPKVCSTK